MQREIKFRVWANADEGLKMIYLDTADFDNGLWFSSPEHIDDYEDCIMQYTGLKDKNSKDIYEGDVLSAVSPKIGPMDVRFENGCFVAYNRFGRWGPLSRAFDYDIKEFYSAEVIGNIYQHPELLPNPAASQNG